MRIYFKGPRGAEKRENPQPITFPRLGGIKLTPGQEADVPPRVGRVLIQTDQAIEVVASQSEMAKEIEAHKERVEEKQKEEQSKNETTGDDHQEKERTSKRKRRSLFNQPTQSDGEIGKPLAEETEE